MKYFLLLFKAILIGGSIFTVSSVLGQEISVDIHRAKKVSPVLYGFHYEEIGMIGDGGLYAEMVRNRGFEEANPPRGVTEKNGLFANVFDPFGELKKGYRMDPLVGWYTLPLTYSPIRIERVAGFPLTEENPHSMSVEVTTDIRHFKGEAAIQNTGFFGMCFRQGEKYRLSFYVRSAGYRGAVAIRLSDEKGKAASAAVSFPVSDREWQKYTAELMADKTVERGMLTIIPEESGKFQLDMVSLFPADTWDQGKSVFRKDIMRHLVDYAPDFLRFPGGCIVHGINEETMYHWKETLGDISRRPGGWSKWSPHYRTDGIGYHEFYELCEYLGADAMYVTSTGMLCSAFVERDKNRVFAHREVDLDFYIQDVLDAIEYALGAPDTRWGAERAKNGHPAPFPLKYVEIGNEDFGPEYRERYGKIYRAIKEKYPQLTLIANSCIWKTMNDKRKDLPEFTTAVEVFDEHYYQDIPWAIDNYHKFDAYDRQGPDLFIGELGIGGKYPKRILAEGILKLSMERNADLSPLISDRPLMRNWDFVGRRYGSFLLMHTPSRSVRTFQYYLCKMFRDNKIDIFYETSDLPGKEIFATAGKDSRSGDYILKVINLSEQEQQVNLNIPGLKKECRASVTLLTDTEERVTLDRAEEVKPITRIENIRFPVKRTLPAYSFSVYRLKK